jgi:hypothetical protein
MNQKEFIELIRLHASAYDVKVVLHDKPFIMCDGLKVSGYFDNGRLSLHVALKNPIWFEILVHEYGHFRQWIEFCKVWAKYEREVKKWDDWVIKKAEMSKERIDREFKIVRNLELDCEKRSVELIKQFNLPIDVKNYIKGANTYIYFYAFVRKNRKWYNKKSPYKVKEIFDMMPAKFLEPHEYNTMPKGYEEAVEKYCFKKVKK